MESHLEPDKEKKEKQKNMHRDVSKKYLSGAKSRIPMSCWDMGCQCLMIAAD